MRGAPHSQPRAGAGRPRRSIARAPLPDHELKAPPVYRYTLTRSLLDPEYAPPVTPERRVLVVMLNPSKADERRNDPTLSACITFGWNWGCTDLDVGNIAAARSTDPRRLLEMSDPIGPGNEPALRSMIERAHLVVCAWGAHACLGDWLPPRAAAVRQLIESMGKTPHVLGFTKSGQPKHPLARGKAFVPRTTQPFPWVSP